MIINTKLQILEFFSFITYFKEYFFLFKNISKQKKKL